MDRIGKSSDFISKCGNFKICASNDHDGTFMPLIRLGDMQDKPVIFGGLSNDFVSFDEAKKIISNQ
jgi:hypothetical protein